MIATIATHFCMHCRGPIPTGVNYCCKACEVLAGRFDSLENTIDPDLLFLDQENFRQLYRHNSSEYPYQLYVEGLHCSSCIHLLEKLPQFDQGVLEARIDYGKAKLFIRPNERFSLASLCSLLNSWGYPAFFLSPEARSNQNIQNENRQSLKRIAVAGACAGNIMLFVIPIYAGLTDRMVPIFNWISFLLFLPILFYSAQSFYQGAWNSLKFRVINVDLPITLALWAGFLLSTFNLIINDPHIYFDSTASFIFLILCSRYLLKRVQQNFLSPIEIKDFFKNQNFQKQQGLEWVSTPLSSLQTGDILKLNRDQLLPADSILKSERALVDVSVVSGEPLPRFFSAGMEVLAGAKSLDEDTLFEVQTSPEKSKLANLLRELDEKYLHKINFVSLTDRIAQYLIISVFAAAVLFFIFYMQVDLQEAFNRSLALIVLACPCALAFGSPLAVGLALRKAQLNGILIKDANVFEKILKIRNVFFDKTGTLTSGKFKLSHSEPVILAEEVKSIILTLERSSHHPLAFSLREAWPEISLVESCESMERLGVGVRAVIGKHQYELKSVNESMHESGAALVLTRDGDALCRLYFEDCLNTYAIDSVQKLSERGCECYLLSGDRRDRALSVGKECGIAEVNIHANLFPDSKRTIVQKYQNTCMIGDGANDSAALKEASVGIAMQGSVQMSLQSADVYFVKKGLEPLIYLWDLARTTRSTLIRNLIFSLTYNSIGAALALGGWISPLLAAILMPISSALIVVSSLWGFRK